MKKIISFILIFALVLSMAVGAYAIKTEDVAGTYQAISCVSETDGQEYGCDGEYIYLGPNGAGELEFAGTVYEFTWDCDRDEIFGEDNEGYEFSGTYEDGILRISYAGYSYVYSSEKAMPGSEDGEGGETEYLDPFAVPYPQTEEKNINADEFFMNLPLVADYADILSDSEERELLERASDLSENYDVYVYILTVENMSDFGFYDIEDLTEFIRVNYHPGFGPDGDMIILALSMATRKYDLAVWGSKGHRAFTDYGCGKMEKQFLDNFKGNDWFGGFNDYLNKAGELLRLESKGRPLDINCNPLHSVLSVVISLLVGFAIASGIASGLRKKMKAPKEKSEANAYIPSGAAQITGRLDRYSHTTESRTYSPVQKSSSGGGSGHSSSGGSHHSGSF